MKNRLKYFTLAILRRIEKIYFSVWVYLKFLLETIGWIIILAILIPVSVGIFSSLGIKNLSNQDFILLVTAVFVLAYTYEAKKLREESVYQRKMSAAHDVQFRIYSNAFTETRPDGLFGWLTSTQTTNTISKFEFVTAILFRPLGGSAPFKTNESNLFGAEYHMSTNDDKNDFLEALRIQDGEIKARVLTTNGIRFIYTYKIVGTNWKDFLDGTKKEHNQNDQFVLISKELDIV